MVLESLAAIAIFMTLWTFFNPTHDENYKQVVAADRRQSDSSVEAMIIVFFVLAIVFFFFGSVP